MQKYVYPTKNELICLFDNVRERERCSCLIFIHVHEQIVLLIFFGDFFYNCFLIL